MATTNRERVGTALDLLREGLGLFVKQEVQRASRELPLDRLKWMVDDPILRDKSIEKWDVSPILKLMNDAWFQLFHDTLGHSGRSLASELRECRNKWGAPRTLFE